MKFGGESRIPTSRRPSSQPGPPLLLEHGTSGPCLKLERPHKLLQKTPTEELLQYSGYEEDNASYTEGVALMLSKTEQRAPIRLDAHGPRIATATFQTKKKKRSTWILCYAEQMTVMRM